VWRWKKDKLEQGQCNDSKEKQATYQVKYIYQTATSFIEFHYLQNRFSHLSSSPTPKLQILRAKVAFHSDTKKPLSTTHNTNSRRAILSYSTVHIRSQRPTINALYTDVYPDLGIESRRRRDFLQPSRPALGHTHPHVKLVPGISHGVNRPGRGVDHPPHSSAHVKQRVQKCLDTHLELYGL